MGALKLPPVRQTVAGHGEMGVGAPVLVWRVQAMFPRKGEMLSKFLWGPKECTARVNWQPQQFKTH